MPFSLSICVVTNPISGRSPQLWFFICIKSPTFTYNLKIAGGTYHVAGLVKRLYNPLQTIVNLIIKPDNHPQLRAIVFCLDSYQITDFH
jgi:hypothetical protein